MGKMTGKKILVTGADGFIGSHLCELLLKQGAHVRALSYYNSFNYRGWLEEIPVSRDLEVVSGDVRDHELCGKIMKGIDIVYHLAALIAIPYSYIAPESYIDTNVKGALHICQAALQNKTERLIQISTSEVYGTAKYVPIDETHPLQAQSPYSASKIGADAVAMSFYSSFSLPVTIARPFNTYGPRQSTRAVIPSVITQIASGQKTIRLGDLTPTRDFNYVADTCRGILLLSQCEQAIGEAVNIGSGDEISISEMAQTIKKLMGSDALIVSESERMRPEKSEVRRLQCNNEKIHQLTGYAPAYSFDQGLRETIAWFLEHDNLKKYKAGDFIV